MSGGGAGIAVAVASWFVFAAAGLGTSDLLLGIGSACGLVVFVRALLRVRVRADEHEVVVVNTWRTHRIHWPSIESIDLAGMFWPSAAALLYVFTPLRIRTRDGGTVYVQASIADFVRVLDYLRRTAPADSAVKWGFRFD